jgi:ubiquinone/menaquinone biosynthesis C-methylase UbiE
MKRPPISPHRMDVTAKLAFRKVYPFLARHIVSKYGITEGWCLDAGSGPGSLAIALASITDLKIIALDIEPDMAEIATANIAEAGLGRRVLPLVSDVHNIPFKDDHFDLIVSRGSVFFWDDRPGALRELDRVLKPGGVIYCGGGMGSKEIRREAEQIIMTHDQFEEMRQFWHDKTGRMKADNESAFEKDLAESGLPGRVLRECSGIWLEIIKQPAKEG